MLTSRSFLLVFSILLLCKTNLRSQGHLKQEADSLKSLADAKFEVEQDAEAFYLFHKALPLYHQIEDSSAWAHCLKFKMWSGNYMGILTADSIDTYLNSIWWSDDIEKANLYRLGGYFHFYRFDNPFRALGPYHLAQELYEKYPTYMVDSSNQYNVSLRVYKPLGRIYSHFGDTKKALAYQMKSLDLFQIQKKWEQYGKMCMDIAGTYWDNKNYKEALDITKKGQVHQDSLSLETFGALLANESQYLSELDSLEEALSPIDQSIRLLSKFRFTEDRSMQFVKSYLHQAFFIKAELLTKLKRIDAAEIAFREAISIAYALPDPGRQVAKLELGIAELRLNQKQYTAALKYCQQALHKVSPDLSPTDYYQNPAPDNLYLENIFIEALGLKAKVFKALFVEKGDPNFLWQAKTCLSLAMKVEEIFFDSYSYESSQWQMLEESHTRHEILQEIIEEEKQLIAQGLLKPVLSTLEYTFQSKEQLLDTLQQLKDLGNNGVETEMFEVAEKSKAMLLQQGVMDKRAMNSLGANAEELRSLSLKISELMFQINVNNRNDLSMQLEIDSLISIRNKLEEELGLLFPAFKTVSNTIVPSIEEIKTALPDSQSMLIEYFWGNTHVYIIGITKDDYSTVQLETDQVEKWAQRFGEKLENAEDAAILDQKYLTAWLEDSRLGYKQLLDPIIKDKKITRLIIVPDGPLSSIPFDVLLYDDNILPHQSGSYSNLPYLLKTTIVYYEHSAALWLDGKKNSKSSACTNYFGIAPNYDFDQSGLNVLNQNQPFIKESARSLGGMTLVGSKATQTNFLQQIVEHPSKVTHFYGHAKGKATDAYGSWMAFTVTNEDDDKGRFYDLEMYGTSFNTELFILSACQSGKGKQIKGEGVFHLARAARFAGAANTLHSIWNVRDDANASIMRSYLKHLKQGLGKAEALRHAKIAYLTNSTLYESEKHPFFWSSYIFLGEDDPIDFISNPWYLSVWVRVAIISLLISLFAILTLKLIRNRKNQHFASRSLSRI